MKLRTLLIDHYDSFTYNLYQYLGELGGNPIVVPHDEISLNEVKTMHPSHIVISPGPGRPENPKDFGISLEVILTFGPRTPLLGVCLGHQGIVHAFGGKIHNAPQVMHGKKSWVNHDQKGLFKGIPSPLEVMRYHSLVASLEKFPEELLITATTDQGLIMGIRHKQYPIEGIQFHPESIGTPHGEKILQNFLHKSKAP